MNIKSLIYQKILKIVQKNDIAYTYGARDVEKKTYRWCACISSQSISYVYAVENEGNIIEEAKDDLLLTMLVLHQKNYLYVTK